MVFSIQKPISFLKNGNKKRFQIVLIIDQLKQELIFETDDYSEACKKLHKLRLKKTKGTYLLINTYDKKDSKRNPNCL